MAAIHGDKLRGHLETLVLSTLERGEAHGLEVLRRLEEAGCGLLRLKEGSLYPALQRMLKAGWLSAEWGVSARNRRVRFYKITPAGRKQLEREVSSFDRMLEGIARVMRPAES